MSSSHILFLLQMLCLLTLNVRGLSSQNKQLCLYEYCKNTRSNLLFLQETNLSLDSQILNPEKYYFFINPPVQPSSGVAIVFNQQLLQQTEIISHHILVQGYLQTLSIKLDKTLYHLINVYMPHNNQTALLVLNSIQDFIGQAEEDSVIIIAGDWNLTLHEEDRWNCKEKRHLLATKLQEIISQHSLSDVWKIFNPNRREFTFKGPQENNPMSRLDRLYVKSKDVNIILNSTIIPAFSDHSGLSVRVSTSKFENKPPYWKMDTTLLQSADYQQIIINILDHYEEKAQKSNQNIHKLWDEIKEEIKFASQRFMKYLKIQVKCHLTTLHAQINHINAKSKLSRRDEELLKSIEKEIAETYKTCANQRLKLIESQIAREANTQSKFFLRLAKQQKPLAEIDALEINGQVTSDKRTIFKSVNEKFSLSFSDQNVNDIDPKSILYHDLPKLPDYDRELCEESLSEEDIFASIQKAQLNRAPGYDGLPIEFYKHFWNNIKSLFMRVVQNFQETGQLPKSMKKIIVRPIPKKGDRLQLKNWRPISLMNTDYKIISRCYSNKLSRVLTTLVTSDQSYCIPGRTIYDNLHLLRNAIRHSNLTKSKLAILSLDQTEAFNKISHKYLFHLLEMHGFGPKFCTSVSALLQNTQGFIKIGSSLLAPFIFKMGMRQGDPIAGPLYVLSIEPFLRLTFSSYINIKGYQIPNSIKTVKATAFADDINFLISQDEDFEKIEEAFKIYSQQSSAQLNVTKSSGLFCGGWKGRKDKPLDCTWNDEGSKYLGVYLGNTSEWEGKNWQILQTKLTGTLLKWSQYVKITSYQGRKIICNQLAGSLLIHTLNVLHPPKKFFQDIQKEMINFMWQGKHWLHPNYVFSAIDKGGLELTNLQAKTNSLRLHLAYKIQKNFASTEPTYLFHNYNLSLYGNVTPEHFFCKKKNPIEQMNLEDFYKSLLSAWHSIEPTPIATTIPARIIRTMPLYESMFLEGKLNIVPDWRVCGFTNVSQLLDENNQWRTLNLSHFPISHQRRITFSYNQIKTYLDKKIKPNEDPHDQLEEIKFQFKSPYKDQHLFFPNFRKTVYHASLKHVMTNSPQVNGKSQWIKEKVNWKELFSYPTDRRDSDISWRLLHNALPTPKKLQQWKIISSAKCPWCQEEGNIIHMIFLCKTVKQLWEKVSKRISTINPTIERLTFSQALAGFPSKTPSARQMNFLLNIAKSTIYRSYMNCIKDEAPQPPAYLQILEKRINYRIALEEHHAQLTQSNK